MTNDEVANTTNKSGNNKRRNVADFPVSKMCRKCLFRYFFKKKSNFIFYVYFLIHTHLKTLLWRFQSEKENPKSIFLLINPVPAKLLPWRMPESLSFWEVEKNRWFEINIFLWCCNNNKDRKRVEDLVIWFIKVLKNILKLVFGIVRWFFFFLFVEFFFSISVFFHNATTLYIQTNNKTF